MVQQRLLRATSAGLRMRWPSRWLGGAMSTMSRPVNRATRSIVINEQVQAWLRQTAVDLVDPENTGATLAGEDFYSGAGLVNVGFALTRGTPDPVVVSLAIERPWYSEKAIGQPPGRRSRCRPRSRHNRSTSGSRRIPARPTSTTVTGTSIHTF